MPQAQVEATGGTPATDPSCPDADLPALRRRLIRLAVKLVWNRDDAEDIVQEAFTLALNRMEKVPADQLAPWMWRTVCNLCLNQRRRRRLEPLSPVLVDDREIAPDSAASQVEEMDRIRGAVAELPDQQRLALVLRTMEGLDYEQIAAVMSLSSSAVRTHVHLARQRLVERLRVSP